MPRLARTASPAPFEAPSGSPLGAFFEVHCSDPRVPFQVLQEVWLARRTRDRSWRPRPRAGSLVPHCPCQQGCGGLPGFPGTRESRGRTRYLPHLLAWSDRSSARVQRVCTSPGDQYGHGCPPRCRDACGAGLGSRDPRGAREHRDLQVIVWQRELDERLDLTQLWPLSNMTRRQRLYGGIFPAEFLDAPLVIEWSWALGGARSPPPAPPRQPLVRPPPPPPR